MGIFVPSLPMSVSGRYHLTCNQESQERRRFESCHRLKMIAANGSVSAGNVSHCRRFCFYTFRFRRGSSGKSAVNFPGCCCQGCHQCGPIPAERAGCSRFCAGKWYIGAPQCEAKICARPPAKPSRKLFLGLFGNVADSGWSNRHKLGGRKSCRNGHKGGEVSSAWAWRKATSCGLVQ